MAKVHGSHLARLLSREPGCLGNLQIDSSPYGMGYPVPFFMARQRHPESMALRFYHPER
jgi:hypothetical protein